MTAQSPCNMLWLLGLDPKDRDIVQRIAGASYTCKILDDLSMEALADILDRADSEDPLLLWLGSKTWLEVMENHQVIALSMELLPTVLVLEPDPSYDVLEQALEARVQQVLRAPVEEAQIFDALSRAREAQNVYHDMSRMAREVMMERELLERKTDVCSFLFHFFSGVGDAANARELVSGCSKAMEEYFALQGLHAVWWGESPNIEYLVGVDEHTEAAGTWYSFLKEQAHRLHPLGNDGPCLCGGGKSCVPDSGKVLMLPLYIRDRDCGFIVLHLRDDLQPSRDMALALDVVRRHLALILWERAGRTEFFAGSGTNNMLLSTVKPLRAGVVS